MPLFQTSAGTGQSPIATQPIPEALVLANPPPPPARIPKCKKGDRYKVPGDEFDADSEDEGDHPDFFYGVVTKVLKTGIHMLFQGDTVVTKYNGHLETWFEHRQDPNDAYQTEEEIFQAIEIIAKLRKPPHKPVSRLRRDPGNRRTTLAERTHTASSSDSSSNSGSDAEANPDDDAGGEDDDEATNEETAEEAVLVDQWESDNEDDENMDEPAGDGNDDADESLDDQYARATWTDVPNLTTDPRAQAGAMPENIAPAFLMPSYRDEPLLSWFLFYMPLPLIALIVKATNEKAKDISWPERVQWKHLRTGEFMRWLGMWILMTIYPISHGGRRAYWRGVLRFTTYMSENRFEKHTACIYPAAV